MSRLMRMAFEEESQAETPTIVMQGPLADVYRQALDTALAKTDPTSLTPEQLESTPGVATESMANDFFLAQHLASQKGEDPDEGSHKSAPQALAEGNTTIYGVSAATADDQTVVDLTRALAQHKPERDFFLVIDATQPGPNSEVVNPGQEVYKDLTATLEGMTRAHGGKTFKNLGELAKHMKSQSTGKGVGGVLANVGAGLGI